MALAGPEGPLLMSLTNEEMVVVNPYPICLHISVELPQDTDQLVRGGSQDEHTIGIICDIFERLLADSIESHLRF
jgi:hypothetical protein